MGATGYRKVRLNLADKDRTDAQVPINATRVFVAEYSGTTEVSVRIDKRDADSLVLRKGMDICEQSGIAFLYLTHVQAPSDEYIEFWIMDSVLIRSAGTDDLRIAPPSFPQETLTGALAAGVTIGSGSEAYEDVDTTGAEYIRAKALLTGTAHPAVLGSITDAGFSRAVMVAVNEADGVGYVVGDSTGELACIDLSDPSTLAILGTYTPATATRALGVQYYKTAGGAKWALVAWTDGTGLFVDRVDVSDPTAPALIDSVTLAAGSTTQRAVNVEVSAASGDEGRMFVGSEVGLFSVNLSTLPTAPVLDKSDTGQNVTGLGVDDDTGVLVFLDRGGHLRCWTWLGFSELSSVGSFGFTQWGRCVVLDTTNKVAYTSRGASPSGNGRPGAFDYSVPGAMVRIYTPSDTNVNGGVGVALNAAGDVLAMYLRGDAASLLIYFYDVSNPYSWNLLTTSGAGSLNGDYEGMRWYTFGTFDGVFAGERDTGGKVVMIEGLPGSDVLRIDPLDAHGDPVVTEGVETTGVRDSQEAVATLALRGENKARITVKGRSGVTTTVTRVMHSRLAP